VTTNQRVSGATFRGMALESRKFPVLSLLAGNLVRGDRFQRTASATRKSGQTAVVSQVPK
jgi:hypothetical protein